MDHPIQHPKLHFDRYSRFAQLTVEYPYYFYVQSAVILPLKLSLRVEIWTPSNTGFLGAHPSPRPISIGSAVFAGLTIVTDRPTMLLRQ